MKKCLSILLVLGVLLCLSLTAFATENTQNVAQNNGMATIMVSGTYDAGEEPAQLINVDIAWGAMSFTYTAGDTSWNPDNHSSTTGEGSWSVAKDTNYITVTNHSNAAVTAAFGFEPAKDVDVTGEFEDDKLTLATAVNTAVADAPSATTYFNITDGTIDADTDLGTITVTISADTAAMKYQVGDTDESGNYIVVEANAETAILMAKSASTVKLDDLDATIFPTAAHYLAAYDADDEVIKITSGKYVVGDANGAPIYISTGSVIQGIQFDSGEPSEVEISLSGLLPLKYYPIISVSNAAE